MITYLPALTPVTERKKMLRQRADHLRKQDVTPTLAIIQVGNNKASETYVRNKNKVADSVGITVRNILLSEETSEEKLLCWISELNTRIDVHGILVQLPLPEHINEDKIANAIWHWKDVDGFGKQNQGALMRGETGLVPCTPLGILNLLHHYDVKLDGADVVIVGRSNIVGKPMAQLLLEANATVTVCHSRTKNLALKTSRADIVICAVGKAKMFDSTYFRDDQVVIDVGINRDENGRLCGDVDEEDIISIGIDMQLTPVPGGVGPMTVVTVAENTIIAAERLLSLRK